MTNLSELEDSSVDYPIWITEGKKIGKCLRSLGDLWNNPQRAYTIILIWQMNQRVHLNLCITNRYVLSQRKKGIIKNMASKFIYASVLMSCVCTYFEMH